MCSFVWLIGLFSVTRETQRARELQLGGRSPCGASRIAIGSAGGLRVRSLAFRVSTEIQRFFSRAVDSGGGRRGR